MVLASTVIKDLKNSRSRLRAEAAARYFKTGKGEYGHGDIFWGVPVPNQRQIAKRYAALPLTEIQKLLQNEVHECRLTALFILVKQYAKGDDNLKSKIAKFYLKNRRHINNWDLVDSSAPQILGNDLLEQPRSILYRLARSKNVWDLRIAILSTFTFIKEEDFNETLQIAEQLLDDKHDLIHKAVGWALREVGNISSDTERKFLKKHAHTMPRTMLRYAIEKFPRAEREMFLSIRAKR